MLGLAPVVRATKACPSSCTSTAIGTITSQTTKSRSAPPGRQPRMAMMTTNEMSMVTGKPNTRNWAIGRPPSTVGIVMP